MPYLDNAVCDVRSWPGGLALTHQSRGSPNDWDLYKTEFGFANDATATEQSPGPTDGLVPAVTAGVLLISCHGVNDAVVPFEDNAAHIIKLWQDHGGRRAASRRSWNRGPACPHPPGWTQTAKKPRQPAG